MDIHLSQREIPATVIYHLEGKILEVIPVVCEYPDVITIVTGYSYKPVTLAQSLFGTGWWFRPVPMVMHWNRLEPPPGANCPPHGRSMSKGTSCCCSRYRWWYRLQQQLLTLAWTDGPFSSSEAADVPSMESDGYTLLENGPSVVPIGTGCNSSWYLWP